MVAMVTCRRAHLNNNTILDEPMKFQVLPKSSVFNRTGQVNINDIEAVKSSNIYMIKAANETVTEHTKDGKLDIDPKTLILCEYLPSLV